MTLADGYFDRYSSSTYNNDYANGLNDENQWEENILDSEVPLDDEESDFLENSDSAHAYSHEMYNETGYDRHRIN